MPISLLTGRRAIWSYSRKRYSSYNVWGEALSLAAAVATIHEMMERNVPAYLAAQGKKLKDGYNALAKELGIDGYTRCSGFDCRSLVSFDASAGQPLELKSYVQQELIKRGISGPGFTT